jgi:hypothetical protein
LIDSEIDWLDIDDNDIADVSVLANAKRIKMIDGFPNPHAPDSIRKIQAKQRMGDLGTR